MPDLDPVALNEIFAAAPLARIDDRKPEGARPRTKLDEQLGGAPDAGHYGLALAALYLRHGLLHDAHELANNIGGAEGNWLHAIMHRMEGDYDNARHWHRKTGKQPLEGSISTLVQTQLPRELCEHRGLIRDNDFQPAALTDAVEALGGAFDSEAGERLRRIQAVELEALFERCTAIAP